MIHSSAIIRAGASIADDVEVGPYSVIGEQVAIGAGTKIGSHSVIEGRTSIGKNNTIFHHVSIGEIPQDKKYRNEDTTLTIGDGNVIREFCSFNTGTIQDRANTFIGNNNWIMAYVHVAHDCVIGNNVIFANCVQLGGHIIVQDHVFLGGFTGVHQFCRIGAHAMTGVGSVVLADIPPFVTVMGNKAKPHGINTEGLKRLGFNREVIADIKTAYKIIYRSGLTLEEAVERMKTEMVDSGSVKKIIEFIDGSKRSIVR